MPETSNKFSLAGFLGFSAPTDQIGELVRPSRLSATQIVAILKEADAGCQANEIWRKYRGELRLAPESISSATYYNWKAKYGGLEASDVKRRD